MIRIRRPVLWSLSVAVVVSLPPWIAWLDLSRDHDHLQGCLQQWAGDVTTLVSSGERLWREFDLQLRSTAPDADRARAFQDRLAEYLAAADSVEDPRFRC